MATTEKPPSDTPRMDAVLAELRARTTRRGERAALAEALGIARPRLSEYLAEQPLHKPNGEMALAMLAWLTERRNDNDISSGKT